MKCVAKPVARSGRSKQVKDLYLRANVLYGERRATGRIAVFRAEADGNFVPLWLGISQIKGCSRWELVLQWYRASDWSASIRKVGRRCYPYSQ